MTFRVLSLDGGGVWSLMQARALIELYGPQTLGRTVLQDFDLVAATSGGAIVLGGLIENYPLEAVLEIFKSDESRRKTFPPTREILGPLIRKIPGVEFGALYSTDKKLRALEEMTPNYGPLPLKDAVKGIRRAGSKRDLHVMMTAFDYDRNRARFFRSAPAGGPGWGDGTPSDVTLVQAINASADPPIAYFDQPADVGPDRYWDGAIAGCTNPVLAAVGEAKVLTDGLRQIVALSLGAGSVALAGPPVTKPATPYQQKRTKACLIGDIEKIAVAIVDDPPDSASFLAHLMTGGPVGLPYPLRSRIVRMSPVVRPVRNARHEWTAPGAMDEATFERLASYGIDAIKKNQIADLDDYATLWLSDTAPNQPIRMNGDTFECEVGHKTFSEAAAAWRQLAPKSPCHDWAD